MPTRRSTRRAGAAAPARRLHGIDSAFVTYERRRGVSVGIGLLARFDGPAPDERRLRWHLAERLDAVPELRWRMRADGWHLDADFDWESRIPSHPNGPLREVAAGIIARPIDPTAAPWRLWLLADPERAEWALLFHAHHAFADGLSLMSLAHHALGSPSPSPWPSRPWLSLDDPSRTRDWGRLLRDGPRQLWNLTPRRRRSPEVSTGYGFDWATVDTAAARRLGDRHGATVNDVVLTAITRALPHRRPATVLIPVGIRSRARRIGNEVAMFRVRLPTGGRDPLGCLRTTVAATRRAKCGPDVAVTRAGQRLLPQPIQDRVLDLGLAANRVDLLISNWGSAEPLSFEGRAVSELVPIMFRPAGHPATIGFASHGQRTFVGVVAAGDPTRLRDGIAAGFGELAGLAEVG